MQLLRQCRNTRCFDKVRTIPKMHCHDYDKTNKCVFVNYVEPRTNIQILTRIIETNHMSYGMK
jgi:hypothetical protein